MLNDRIDLHRLVWSPDDFNGEFLLTSAFRRQDLSGCKDDFVSVSRTDTLNPKAEIAMANNQAAKTGTGSFKREEAWSVILNFGDVKNAVDSNDTQPFLVTEEPIPNENEAHCGIRNNSGKKSRGYVNELRAILVSLAKDKKPLDKFLEDIKHG